MLYMIPDRNRIEETVKLAQQYQTYFEYNDFCDPKTYTDQKKTDELVEFYLGLDRDRSKDTLHGAFLDITPHSQDPSVKESSCRRMEQSMSIAQRLGVRAVIFHTNTIPNFRSEAYIKNWADCNEQIIRELLSRYPDQEIYYENMFDTTPDDLLTLAQRLKDEKRFGVCLDYSHVQVFGRDIENWVRILAPYIRHMHINDNDLKQDLHMAIGTGKIDWRRYEELIRSYVENASVLVETHTLDEFVTSATYMEQAGSYPFSQYPRDQRVHTNEELREIIQSCIALTNEPDRNKLLACLLQSAMDITHCDAGTIYLKKGNTLEFRVMRTISQGIDQGWEGEPIDIPPVALKEENVCGYCAIHDELVNIADVYDSDRFDFEGPKKYDAITGYRTRSMIVIPIQNEKKAMVGVMQLMNAKDATGADRSFTQDDEFVLRALSSLAAVLIFNMTYIAQIRKQMNSFVASFATAVDQKTPYNGLHTRKVAIYAKLIAEEINRKYAAGELTEYFDEDRMERLVMASMLHDIGKIITPLEIMNKESRLAGRLATIEQRFELLKTLYERDYYKGVIDKAHKEAFEKELQDGIQVIRVANTEDFITNDRLEEIKAIAEKRYVREDGSEVRYLTPQELHCLSIRKGTLTPEERSIMEQHVQMTKVILDKVYFSEDYEQVPKIAVAHHERLDGSGYPNHILGDDLSLDARILVVADIYDALTSKDRPYKKMITRETAFQILYDMVNDGKLDQCLVYDLESVLKNIPDEEIQSLVEKENLTWETAAEL